MIQTTTPASPVPFTPGQVVVFGSLNADLTVRVDRFPQPGETLSGSELVTAPGGKSSNQAVALAVLGSPVRLVGAVGADPHGRFLLHQAKGAGVDVRGVATDGEHATGTAMIVVDAAGENTIIVSPGANGAHGPDSVGPHHFEDAKILCLCLEVPLPAVEAAARHARRAGAQVVFNLSPYQEVPTSLLELTDVLLVNRVEAGLVLGRDELSDDWPAALEGFVALGIDRAVVTLGAEGSVVLDATRAGQEQITVVDPIAVEVVDTTGCGDAFTGALAHGLAGGATLADASRFAAQISALAATAQGAQTSYSTFARA